MSPSMASFNRVFLLHLLSVIIILDESISVHSMTPLSSSLSLFHSNQHHQEHDNERHHYYNILPLHKGPIDKKYYNVRDLKLILQLRGGSKKSSSNKTSKRKRKGKCGSGITSTASGKQGECNRRIKSEWKQLIKLGIGYDWISKQTITINGKYSHKSQLIDIGGDDVGDDVDNKDSQQHEMFFYKYNYIRIGPFRNNLLHWHFSVKGPTNSVYEQGIYHGRIILPKDYPGSPPRVQMLTPSGRFVTGEDICLSASAYHPETWTPRWTILSLVEALRIHMLTTANEIGGVNAKTEHREKFALSSRVWRMGCFDHRRMIEDGLFCDLSSISPTPTIIRKTPEKSGVDDDDGDHEMNRQVNISAEEEMKRKDTLEKDDETSQQQHATSINLPTKSNIKKRKQDKFPNRQLEKRAFTPRKNMDMLEETSKNLDVAEEGAEMTNPSKKKSKKKRKKRKLDSDEGEEPKTPKSEKKSAKKSKKHKDETETPKSEKKKSKKKKKSESKE